MLPKIPNDFMDLVEQDSEGAFFAKWQEKVGQYYFYRVVGFDEVLKHAGIRFADIFDNDDLKQATIDLVPESWKREFPRPPADWSSFKKDQVTWAKDSGFQRFDKACMSVLYLYAALRDIAGHKVAELYDFFDLFHYVKIRPALFAVEGFDKDFYDANIARNEKLENDALSACGQIERRFLLMAAAQGVITRNSAIALRDFFKNERGFASMGRVICRPTRPIKNELEQVSYDIEELVATDAKSKRKEVKARGK
ncbi:MAG: hypothetical protein WDM86_09095 [Rhizomicrobium sp.]